MPGFTAHYLFGQTIYRQLDASCLKKTIRKYHAAYNLGLQGPDLFFYFLPSYMIHENNIGSVAHTSKTNQFLRHLIESCNLFSDREQRETAQSYTAGFLGHYTLDAHCHPYVYWRSGYSQKNFPKGNRYHGRHMSLETDIDRELLQFYRHCLPSSFPQYATLSLRGLQKRTIAAVLHYAYRRTYPELCIPYAMVYLAVCAIQGETRLLYDPSGRKKAAAWAVERLFLGYPLLSAVIPSDIHTVYRDSLNLCHRPWKNPWAPSTSSRASFLELMEHAEKDYLKALERLEQLFSVRNPKEFSGARRDLLTHLGNKSYHSGLSAEIPS